MESLVWSLSVLISAIKATGASHRFHWHGKIVFGDLVWAPEAYYVKIQKLHINAEVTPLRSNVTVFPYYEEIPIITQ